MMLYFLYMFFGNNADRSVPHGIGLRIDNISKILFLVFRTYGHKIIAF